jgi:hypothetical protein
MRRWCWLDAVLGRCVAIQSLDLGVAATMCLSLCALLLAQQDGASDTEPPLDAGVLGRHGLVAAGERLIGISCRAACWCCIRCSAAIAESGGVCTSAWACRCSC